jgi:heptosyltransferase-2
MRKTIDKPKVAKIYFNKKRLVFMSILDKLLSFLYSFKHSSPINHDCKQYDKILILESHLIGDVIMGMPAYRAIRKRFFDSELIFWGNRWGKDLLEDQQLFDKFFITCIPWSTYDYSLSNLMRLFSQIRQLRRLKIDIALDFRGDIRNIFLLRLIKAKRRISYDFTGGAYWLTDIVTPPENYHIIDRNLKVAEFIGAENKQLIPKLSVPQTKVSTAQKFFNKIGLKKIVFLQPGASQPKRFWVSERFSQVADYLNGKGYSPVLLCGPSDKTVVESIRNGCQNPPNVLSVPLADIPAYLACGEAFIGLDSGIGHVAAALGKNVIMLFGPQLPTISSARGDGMIQIIIRGDFECRPCAKAICDRNNACMKAIQVEDVIEAIDEIENV